MADTLWRGLTAKDRFNQAYEVDASGCWVWKKRVGTCGYGWIWYNNRDILAHRVSWVIHNGPLDSTQCLCHICDNRRCVNPNHLFIGTRADNTFDRDDKGRTARGENHGKYKHGKYVNQKRRDRRVKRGRV